MSPKIRSALFPFFVKMFSFSVFQEVKLQQLEKQVIRVFAEMFLGKAFVWVI